MDEIDMTYNNLLNSNNNFQISDILVDRKHLKKYLLTLLSFDINLDYLNFNSLNLLELNIILDECFGKVFLNSNKLTLLKCCSKIRIVDNYQDINGFISYNGIKEENDYKLFLDNIEISLIPSYEGICSIMHEYAHAMELDHYPVYKNIYHQELFAILVELMTSINIDNILGNNNVSSNQEILRLYCTSKDAKSYLFSNEVERKKRVSNIDNLNYIISTIYALLLSDYYRYYPDTFMKMFGRIINGENKIEDLINYFNIKLDDKTNLYSIKKRVKNN